MSGTAAPDPRIELAVEHLYADIDSFIEPPDHRAEVAADMLADLDAADRAAGVIRVRTDDATVEKLAKALALRDYDDYGKDTEYAWTGLSDYGRREYLLAARAVLEALATPPPVD